MLSKFAIMSESGTMEGAIANASHWVRLKKGSTCKDAMQGLQHNPGEEKSLGDG
jgi:hypothetical protein